MKRIVTLIVILTMAFAISAQSNYSPCYTNNIAKGDAAFKQGRYSEAKTYYANAKKCAGGNPTAAQQKINSCDAKIKAQKDAAEAKRKAEEEAAEAKRKAEQEAAAKKAEQERLDRLKTQGWIDLGLPSGTLWKNKNEEGGFYTYEQAVSKFGSSLPTEEQLEELKNSCNWTWNGSGYKVTGPNGNFIVLPSAGYRLCSGRVDFVGSNSGYWSSTPSGSDGAWSLYFNSDRVYMYYNSRCNGRSVRLVQD